MYPVKQVTTFIYISIRKTLYFLNVDGHKNSEDGGKVDRRMRSVLSPSSSSSLSCIS